MNGGLDPDLIRLLKRLKLGQLAPTLPERLALARAQQLDYAAFLTLLLADEVQRRDHQALERHLQQAGFEDRVVLDGFDWSAPIQVDRRQVQALFSLDFLRQREHVFFVGPVGVGKTMLAQCLGTSRGARWLWRALQPRRRPAQGARSGARRPHLREDVPPLPRSGPADRG